MISIKTYFGTCAVFFLIITAISCELMVAWAEQKTTTGQATMQINEAQQETAHAQALLLETNTSRVTLTAYHPWSGGINSDSDPDKTATMTEAIPGLTCALSSSLVEQGWLGQKIYIEGYGIFNADDRMSTSLLGDRIDLCLGSKKTALSLGRKHKVLAVRLVR